MYTCCPICKTNFNVTEAQLQVAQGKVRCGSCKNVFNARQHINYHPLSSKLTSKNTSEQKSTQSPVKPVPARDPLASRNMTNDSNRNTPLKPKEEIQPESVVTPKHTAETKKSVEHINIDAIFNALDTQLSQGTYIDIAKPAAIDIREAAFDDIFNDDDAVLKHEENHSITDSGIKADHDQIRSADRNNDTNIDLDISAHDIQENNHLNETSAESIRSPIESKKDETKINKPLNHINSHFLSKETGAPNSSQKQHEKALQQHTFDFVALPDEADLSSEEKEQLASVNKPLDATGEYENKQQADRKALHQAIDNIIKVDNNIPTPFEENDADHFVIEVESEPDVELVDEDDLDKLFASTDSLSISDLKFDNYKTTREREEHVLAAIQDKIKAEVEPAPEPKLELEPEENQSTSFNLQVEDNVNPDNFSSDSLTTDDFNAEDFNPDSINIENVFDETEFEQTDIDTALTENELEGGIDESHFEEEIILSSAEIDDVVPHQLRDAVASLEQPPLSLQKRLLYSVSILILLGLLGIQLVLFKSTAIANMLPVLQPLLVSMCQNLPCRYTGNHNSKQIKIINRDVRLHPKIKGALLISATIINQASYTQPYPTILLKFTDLTGATVAQRYFQPTEYLGLLNKPFALMPSKKPVQLNIEILDPGSDAINFQFFFL